MFLPVMLSCFLGLALFVAGETDQRLRLELEEGGSRTYYLVDFRPGALRIEPEGTGIHLLLDTRSRSVTLIDRRERFFCRLTPAELRDLMAAGVAERSWFPWVYRVSPDLVDDLSLKPTLERRFMVGREARRLVALSGKYGRPVAEYWVDPAGPRALFFQWREVYLPLWGEGDPAADAAQRKRLELYDQLSGLPLLAREQFALLSRPRTLRITAWERTPADAFGLPSDFAEKSAGDLRWEAFARRLLQWFQPKRRPDRRSPGSGFKQPG